MANVSGTEAILQSLSNRISRWGQQGLGAWGQGQQYGSCDEALHPDGAISDHVDGSGVGGGKKNRIFILW